jgi:hypothetical protein
MTASYVAWAMLVSVKFTVFITLTGIVLFFLLRKFCLKHFSSGMAMSVI